MPIWCRPISTMKVSELSRMMSTKNEQNNKKKGREKSHRSGGKLSFKKRQFVTGDEEETLFRVCGHENFGCENDLLTSILWPSSQWSLGSYNKERARFLSCTRKIWTVFFFYNTWRKLISKRGLCYNNNNNNYGRNSAEGQKKLEEERARAGYSCNNKFGALMLNEGRWMISRMFMLVIDIFCSCCT